MDGSAEKIWESAQEKLRTLLQKDLYELWFAKIRGVSVTEKEFTLEVANDFIAYWFKNNYLSLIQDVLAFVTGRQLDVVFNLRQSAGKGADDGAGNQGKRRQAGGAQQGNYGDRA